MKRQQCISYFHIAMVFIVIFSYACNKDASTHNTDTNSTIKDNEGNVYKTVKIGEQWWMAENLKSTRLNDGTVIPNITNNTSWKNLVTPAYCWYDNDRTAYAGTYGALYNWYAIETGKLCPSGWHVPTDEEWSKLIDFLGGDGLAGGQLKEAGLTHWNLPNTGATNSSGFTALPGGYSISGVEACFYGLGNHGTWWSSTAISASNAWFRSLTTNFSTIFKDDGKMYYGLSVRCLKVD
jgi:uncharacterized protein (TIGR02145 family)